MVRHVPSSVTDPAGSALVTVRFFGTRSARPLPLSVDVNVPATSTGSALGSTVGM